MRSNASVSGRVAGGLRGVGRKVPLQLIAHACAAGLLVKAINKLTRKQEAKAPDAPKPAEDVLLLREIRDLLARR